MPLLKRGESRVCAHSQAKRTSQDPGAGRIIPALRSRTGAPEIIHIRKIGKLTGWLRVGMKFPHSTLAG
jgi:hypothetical protein